MKSQQGPNMDGPTVNDFLLLRHSISFSSSMPSYLKKKKNDEKISMTKFCPESAGARQRQIRSEESEESESRGSRKRTVKHTVKHTVFVDQAMPLERIRIMKKLSV